MRITWHYDSDIKHLCLAERIARMGVTGSTYIRNFGDEIS
jgi:hypothetical protein